MPIYAIAIEKAVSFRGATQPFSNVYHYRVAAGAAPNWTPVLDELVAIEKQLHAAAVSFVQARIWTAGGTKEQNQMVEERALSGTGAGSTHAAMDRERALLIRWPAGKDSRGKAVYLRKWFHCCGSAAGVTFSDAILQNTAQIPQSNRDGIMVEANKLRLIGLADEFLLVAASGREHTGPGQCHPYLEHHQLGDQWR